MLRSFAVVIAASALAACQGRTEDGGATVSRNYSVGSFQQIEVAGPYDVEVRTGSSPSVSGQGGEKLLQRAVVEVQGDKLVIPKFRVAALAGAASAIRAAKRTKVRISPPC